MFQLQKQKNLNFSIKAVSSDIDIHRVRKLWDKFSSTIITILKQIETKGLRVFPGYQMMTLNFTLPLPKRSYQDQGQNFKSNSYFFYQIWIVWKILHTYKSYKIYEISRWRALRDKLKH